MRIGFRYMKLRYHSFQLQLKTKETHQMLELIQAFLTRLSTGQLVYSTRKSVQSKGLFTDLNITTYTPGPKSSNETATIWIDEDIHKEVALRSEYPVIYMEVDRTDGFTPTGLTMSVADYQASLKSVPQTNDSEPVPESAPI